MRSHRLLAVCLGLAATSVSIAAPAHPIEFNRDIRPVLSDNCFYCHGPDPNHRKADLRLDNFEGATEKRKKGGPAIVPGNSAKSPLVQRITTTDADDLMPPPETHKKLTPKQIALFKQWIDEGAKYQSHWAYTPIQRTPAPKVKSTWPINDIDRFIVARLDAEGLQPSPEADRRTLLRRLSFDLTGLPPTAVEAEAFIGDKSPQAYEHVVDRLLESPRYGERMAMWWLDLVRYADTVGYHGDQNVSVWPFRDYVIKAFNANMRFDQFTTEQLAGDLLPNATREQQVAAGYNRLGMMSAEGGVQPKEYLAKYAAERVRNLGNVWLAATTGCTECHDHKFDPWTMKDFYSFQTFFADIKERGLYDQPPRNANFGPKLLLTTPEQDEQLKKLDAQIAAVKTEVDAKLPDAKKKVDAWLKQLRNEQKSAGKITSVKVQRELTALIKSDGKATPGDREKLEAFYLEVNAPELSKQAKELAKLQTQRDELEATIPSMLVVEHVEPREIRLLKRGNWMDDSGPIMKPEFPAFLPNASASTPERRLTCLDLARWLMRPENPLPARAFVNRLWAMYFGVGISKRLDDFGAQGEPPVHPELLDHLAASFIDTGWNIKAVIKQIVMSATYRQSSVADSRTVELDPYNRLYARQGRSRLPAEMIRDNALAVSGLLSPTMYGRSVRPYQPPGYYAQLNFPKREYQEDTGENLWRRSVYSHWQRQYLHPAMLAFDAPSREECVAERVRSNTPLQSLVLLNDPEFVEAARVLAERAIQQGGSADESRLTFVFNAVLDRSPTAAEAKVLLKLLTKHRGEYAADVESAKKLVVIGKRPVAADIAPAELAAWMSVTRTMLNLHETITRD
jgi:hypothetical protein